MEPSDCISVSELRGLLGIGRTTLYRLLKNGQIPGAVRVGDQWRIHRPTLLQELFGLVDQMSEPG